ncbi:aspartate--tRNA ligase [Marinimicrococcus flavescens]|uniref:Aspartate--tRNA(Asp/Asn) ligase n=1 Tax=Marinimicrococcus flavescens TaxID=3031815 RepID=A0AAP4D646_9PROT|nr:aspartate--tRNA ligase [Marinimicrococcus flavescens]
MHLYRTHHCGELRKTDVGASARLSGWVHRKRDHGQLLFVDLRDHTGITQVVFQPDTPIFAEAEALRLESVVTVTGAVVARSPETVNPGLPTGAIELVAERLELRSHADVLPLQVNSDREQPEETRLAYRFLDLRRDKMQRNIRLRSAIIASIRRRMHEQGFTEFQTPILTASSPEGARDFLVPSRLHPGRFYALPQAPQQYKQLYMMSGFDRYFQIAPCFRDEDARADRSPGEFYQLDVEMAFVEQEDVFAAVEPVMHGVFEEFKPEGWTVTPAPFPHITYRDAMLKYGVDKPDLRNPIEIADVSEVFRGSAFKVFAGAVEKGSVVRAIPAPGAVGRPRSFFDGMVGYAQSLGAPGLGWIAFAEDGAKGPIAKFLDEERLEKLKELAGLKTGDAVFFACDKELAAAKLAGAARLRIGDELDICEKGTYRFCWIVDFPMYEWDEELKQVTFSHNPFSMPQGGLEALESKDPLDILAFQYDIVCNGTELSSGAIRNHRPDIMEKAFAIAGYPADELEKRFGGMLKALRYGAPPHGGIAPGLDRIVMLLADTPNLREVTAFPLSQRAEELLLGAPSTVGEKQLKELHIQLSLAAREKLREEQEQALQEGTAGGEAAGG